MSFSTMSMDEFMVMATGYEAAARLALSNIEKALNEYVEAQIALMEAKLSLKTGEVIATQRLIEAAGGMRGVGANDMERKQAIDFALVSDADIAMLSSAVMSASKTEMLAEAKVAVLKDTLAFLRLKYEMLMKFVQAKGEMGGT